MPPDSHEEFQELCALSFTGELTEDEHRRLEAHLVRCEKCRQALHGYEQIVTTTIPKLGASLRAQDEENAPGYWSIEQAEIRLLQSLPQEAPRSGTPVIARGPFWWKYAPRFAMAAAVILACSLAGYRLGVLHERGLLAHPVPALQVASTSSTSPNRKMQIGVPSNPTKAAPGEDPSLKLRAQFREKQQELDRINDRLNQSEDARTKETAELERTEQDRTDLVQKLSAAQADQRSLEARLSLIRDQTAQDMAQSGDLKAQVRDLTAALEEKDKAIAREQELLKHDSDIRNLIGARDLYIAEIYDVAKTGDTQKPFGRVFYTKDKSLIFYGYDLDQQQGIRKDAAFQAWGRSRTDQTHDVSLGLLFQDDANKKRWVLKYNDAKTIAQIEAVFVTVEPEGGSAKPSGKPLLFTYLRLDPNHP
jgi:hypothetical protein